MTDQAPVSTEHEDTSAELEALLHEQLELYGRLRGLADRQRQLVARDDPQPLLALLGERQKVVDELSRLSERLLPVQRAWRRDAPALAPDIRGRIEDLLQRIGGTLQSVMDSDAEDARLLAARRAQTRVSAERVTDGQQALSAYHAASGTASPHPVATDQSI